MHKARLTALTLCVGALAVALPALIAIHQARNLSLDAEKRRVQGYARDVLLRTELSLDQVGAALAPLREVAAEPCSESSIQLMRDLIMRSSRLHALGHVSDNRLLCSSLGLHGAGLELGPIDIVSGLGTEVRSAVTFPAAPDTTFMTLGRDGFVAILHPSLLIDSATDADDVSLAAITLENPQVQSARGVIDSRWLARVRAGPPVTFVDDTHVVSIIASDRYLAAALAATPLTGVNESASRFTRLLVPISVGLCLALLAFMTALLRKDFALRALTDTLRERIKELTLLHKAASLLQGSKAPDQIMLTELAALLPPAFQYPERCASRIVYGTLEATTPNWRAGGRKLASAFTTADGRRGNVEVAYLEEPAAAKFPFLDEEKTLLASVTEMLAAQMERRLVENRVTRLAYYESVTGLPNRSSLEARLGDSVQAARETERPFALILMNLRAFRDVNETLGHRNGDELLRYVTQDLRKALFERDLLASLGGDEFAIVLSGLAQRADIDKVIAKIGASLHHPTTIAGIPVKVEGAIGIALFPEHGDSAELLWQHADVALRSARETNREYTLYSPEIDHYHPQRIALLGELLDAIENGQLVLHYQPKIDLATGRPAGVEALVRWQHPVHGLIYPDRFVFLAERTQLINPLTRAVLTRAVRECRAFHDAGFPLDLSVNLSVRNLLDSALCAEIPSIVAAAGFPLKRLILEITESAVIADPERALRSMAELDRQGFALSLDDFGIGQSSLSYLKDLPVSKLKIDKSFVIGMTQERNAAIVAAAIRMGHSLSMQVTAEGVEDTVIRDRLRDLGCDLGQGYLFAKPLPPDALLDWLRLQPL